MKTHYKWIAIWAILFLPMMGLAQETSKVTFAYDADGNRIMRSWSIMKMEENGNPLPNGDLRMTEQPKAADIVLGTGIEIYPNPTDGLVHIDLQGDSGTAPFRATLSTQNGTIIHDRMVESSSESLDISSQASGVYILVLTSGNERHVWKIIKR